MAKISFLTRVEEQIEAVESLMHAQASGYHPDLQAALDHLLSSGGKRVRPALTLLVGQMLDGPTDRLITLAAAIEMLHTATLVHDDLIDSSLLRRGIPTLNAHWSTGATVLTGDFIFARAAKLSAETDSVAVMKLFAQTLTTIVNGEISQLFFGPCQPCQEEYYQRIYAKTASLFETAATSAALVSDLDEAQTEFLRLFGKQIGLAFQIVDDILDFTGDQVALGKPVGNDLRQGIITLPVLLYVEANPHSSETRFLLTGQCDEDEIYMDQVINTIAASPAIQSAYQQAASHIEQAIAELHRFAPTAERQALEDLAKYIIERRV